MQVKKTQKDGGQLRKTRECSPTGDRECADDTYVVILEILQQWGVTKCFFISKLRVLPKGEKIKQSWIAIQTGLSIYVELMMNGYPQWIQIIDFMTIML